MPIERVPGSTNMIDVLDRVLDKGIVIDAWARIYLVGIDLFTIDARVVVASIDTYVQFAERVTMPPPVAGPPARMHRPRDIATPTTHLGRIFRAP